MLNELSVEEKLRLVRFVCSFAWSDLDVAERERTLVRELIGRLELPPYAVDEALTWLEHPPSEEDLDPYDVPEAHRRLFVDMAAQMVGADGVVNLMEMEHFAIFHALMGADEE